MDYQIPESTTTDFPSYFKSTPLRRWNVRGYMQYSSLVENIGTNSRQFHNAVELIENSSEIPIEVKRLLSSPAFKTKLMDKEDASVNINHNNTYSHCAVSSSGNAKVVFHTIGSSGNAASSSSSRVDNTGTQSRPTTSNKGKRKAADLEESEEPRNTPEPEPLGEPEEIDEPDTMDSLFRNSLSSSVPSLPPSEFRKLVYMYGTKALSNSLYMSDVLALQNIAQNFTPTTLGEQLDLMSAKLALEIDLNNNALKLSLSRVVDTVNGGVTSVFRKYLDNMFWNNLHDIEFTIEKGMASGAKQFFQEILARGTINNKIDKKRLRIAIAEEKMNQLEIDQTEYIQILDILEIVTKNCLIDRSIPTNDDKSELSYYRQFAKILDLNQLIGNRRYNFFLPCTVFSQG